MKKRIKLIKTKHYKFGISLIAGIYDATEVSKDVWQVKQGNVSLSLGLKDFEFVV